MMNSALSIIIPTLNEAEALPLLLTDLAHQEGIIFDVIVADGASVDETVDLATEWFASGRLNGKCIVGECGRGKQLNAGAQVADSEWLLFLHADSRLPEKNQLQNALKFISSHVEKYSSDTFAGRFVLSFDGVNRDMDLAFYYYETKAKLGRPGSIHGDQGMLLKSTFFEQVGPFREDLPVMEDTSLAELIRDKGQWLLLPGKIVTSSRRFQSEGCKERQTLNALMMNFLAIGWLDFFLHAPELYRQQKNATRLQLSPFFDLISDLLRQMTWNQRYKVWLATGGYVRSQAWQIGLFIDCKKAHKTGAEISTAGPCLRWIDNWFEPLTNNCFCRAITAFLVRIWFVFKRL
jgi:rSAM/selenodomain-associated transferase 2